MEQEKLDGIGPSSRHYVLYHWPDFNSHSTAKTLWDILKMKFGKVGEALTHLQMVNLITLKMTDSENLLTQVQRITFEFSLTVTQNFLKILSCSLSVPHYHWVTKIQHANTWIISMILPSTNCQTLLPESSKRRIAKRLTPLQGALPLISSP